MKGNFFFSFLGGKIGYFEGSGQVHIVLGSTHIVEQLLSSVCPSILTFDFDLILGLILTFWGPKRLLLGSNTVLRSTHVLEQLSFSVIPSILTFEFDLILGLFCLFWGLNKV